MNFIFLRHSVYEQPTHVPSALLPHPITDEGIAQAKAGAQKIVFYFEGKKTQFPKYIECSSLLRAYQTAVVIAEEIFRLTSVELKIIQTDELVERKLGAMANLTVGEIETIMEKDPRYQKPEEGWKSSSDYCLPYLGCESLHEAGERVANYIQSIPDFVENDVLGYRLLIGHGASFRHACHQLGLLSASDIAKLSMFYAEPLFFDYREKTWSHVGGDWKVRTQKDKID